MIRNATAPSRPDEADILPLSEFHAEAVPRQDRARHAYLANKKQELLAPPAAILELNDILLKDARERGQGSLVQDLERIQASAQRLAKLVGELLDPEGGCHQRTDFAQHVRHDLRTPLTHIIGLCELLLEDAPDLLLEGFVNDLTRIHALSDEFLVSIDDLLGFGNRVNDSEIHLDPVFHEVKEVVDSFPPQARPATTAEQGNILVVDDNATNRDILCRRLTRVGHKVATATNGREALDILRKQSFDLVLLDIIMPELNGFQVLDALKADETLRHIPVIMISAFGELDSVVGCIEKGAEDYLSKPFNPILLQARINACLEKKRLRDREVHLREQIEKERKRADELLHVILPGEIVKELMATNAVRSRRFDQIAVLFCDIVGFTSFCDNSDPEEVVPYLKQLVEAWEEIALRYEVEKIKTIGDAFMAASGLLKTTQQHPVLNCVRCGLEMIAACQNLPIKWNARVGIHLGPVVAGVIGTRQYQFDVWGDTVNIAARMESNGVPGHVTLSSAAWKAVSHLCRGETSALAIKGKGQMEMVRFDGFLTPAEIDR